VILPSLHYGRDGILAVALTLQLMAERQTSISVLAKAIPSYHIEKQKVEATGAQVHASKEALKRRFSDAEYDERDGLRFAWPKSWVHVRPSNTEPVVRVIAEAPTRAEAEKLCAAVAETLR